MSNATDTFPKLDGDSYSENIFLSCVICDCFVSLDKCLKIYVTVVLIISPLVSVIKLWHIYMYNPCHPLIIHVRLTPETVSISFNFYRMQQIHNCNRSSILDLLTIIVNAIDTCPKPDSDSYTENLFWVVQVEIVLSASTNVRVVLTLSSPVVSNVCTSQCSGPSLTHPFFYFFLTIGHCGAQDLWRSGLSDRVPECQKIKRMV